MACENAWDPRIVVMMAEYSVRGRRVDEVHQTSSAQPCLRPGYAPPNYASPEEEPATPRHDLGRVRMGYAVRREVINQGRAECFLEQVHRVVRVQIHRIADFHHRERFLVALCHEASHLLNFV